MVKGVQSFKKRLRDVPDNVRNEVVLSMQRLAERVTREMRAFNPLTDADIEINWTWGDAPKGSVTLGTVRSGKNKGKTYDQIAITLYARGRYIPEMARWFEYGTSQRVQKKTGRRTGRITAQPYFFPVYRANEKRISSTIGAAVRRGFKKS